MATSSETFQISADAAEFYESRFVPRLFAKWAGPLVDAAALAPGQKVLDVACGTGIVARAAAERVGAGGAVTGLDLNDNMLAVARRLRPDIEWKKGDAAQLPFADESFDAVLCQSALMFFPQPVQALREMARVARGDGTIAVQLWGALASQPAYSPFVDVAARHAGPEAVSLLSAYWSLGDMDAMKGMFDESGLEVTSVLKRLEPALFDSIDELVHTEVDSTPLAERIDAEAYRRIIEDSRAALRSFVKEDGSAEIPMVGYIITGRPQ